MTTMTWKEISDANEKVAYERLDAIRRLRKVNTDLYKELEKARKRILELELELQR